MCFVGATRTSTSSVPPSPPPATAPRHAGRNKRPLELTVYDPAAAAEARQHANAAAALPGPLVPYLAPPSLSSSLSSSSLSELINAVPISAFAPKERAEPRWAREKLFPYLKLRFDLPVHFVAEKAVTATDLDPHQNRFRLPTDGVIRNLRPVLSPLELAAANLLHDEAPRPRPPRQLVLPEDQNQEGMKKKKKRKGKKHGGLPVLVVDYEAGIRELQMSRWESTRGIIIKGEGYLDFIAECSFKVGDVVEIWAFRERFFRLFGTNVCADSPLFVLIAKKG